LPPTSVHDLSGLEIARRSGVASAVVKAGSPAPAAG
jgi:hypothetical protein